MRNIRNLFAMVSEPLHRARNTTCLKGAYCVLFMWLCYWFSCCWCTSGSRAFRCYAHWTYDKDIYNLDGSFTVRLKMSLCHPYHALLGCKHLDYHLRNCVATHMCEHPPPTNLMHMHMTGAIQGNIQPKFSGQISGCIFNPHIIYVTSFLVFLGLIPTI